MPQGDPYFDDCKQLGVEQLFKLLIVKDSSGNPAIRFYNPTNEGLTPVLITDPAAPEERTLTGMYGALATWRSDNLNKTIVHLVNITGDDGQNGILILYS